MSTNGGVPNRHHRSTSFLADEGQRVCDLYRLAWILHDWDDPAARAILENVRIAIPRDGRLLVIESVLPEGDEPHFSRFEDIVMNPRGIAMPSPVQVDEHLRLAFAELGAAGTFLPGSSGTGTRADRCDRPPR